MRTHFLCPAILLCIPLVTATRLSAQSNWQQIGKTSEWANTVMLRNMNGIFYSLESDGTLYAGALIRVRTLRHFEKSKCLLFPNLCCRFQSGASPTK